MRAVTFVPILILALSSIALQGCEVDSSEHELDELDRAADLCGPGIESDSTTTPLGCELEIPKPPEGDTFDPTKVNITLVLDPLRMTIPFVESESECDGDGWYYSPNNLEPKSIMLCPSTCAFVKTAENVQIEVVLGCKTEHD
jgi:hypothetical protein